MIDEAVRAMPQTATRIALLATRPTVEAGTYQAAIEPEWVEQGMVYLGSQRTPD